MNVIGSNILPQAESQRIGALANPGDYVSLLKPRVMSLVVFTAIAGLLAAPGHLHPFLAVIAIFCIAVSAGAAGAINMWYDRDIDAIMSRTAGRPIPQGRICPDEALAFGVILTLGSVMLMGVAVNWVAASLLALASAFYIFIYTIWLKRRTPQNIVIGGAAGAFPPMIGWAAVTGDISLVAGVWFAIIFLWTPPHFWALALFKSDDYKMAKVPMLPVVAGPLVTKKQMLLYTLILLPVSMIPVAMGAVGWVYGVPALGLGTVFIYHAVKVLNEDDNITQYRAAKRMFGFSIVYLFAIFAALIADRLISFGGW
jgi:protoheme IX farnesyltransferase